MQRGFVMGVLALLLLGGLVLGFALPGSDDDDDTSGEQLTGSETDTGNDDVVTRVGNTFTGTTGDDSINGSREDDIINTREGEDTVRGWTGNDEINDLVEGGTNSDNDIFFGGEGNDSLTSTGGADALNGGLNADVLRAFDTGSAPNAPDTLEGGFGGDSLFGDDGDVMTGGPGNDVFTVTVDDLDGNGAVTITDYTAGDQLFINVTDPDLAGEASEQSTVRETSTGAVISVAGTDVVTLNGVTASDISDGSVQVNGDGLEQVSRDGDTITGTTGDDSINGTREDDIIRTRQGEDTVRAWLGNDFVTDFEAGTPNTDDDTFYGGEGRDTLQSTGGSDLLNGGLRNDVLFAEDRDGAEDNPDTLEGGFGADLLVGDDGDFFTGGPQNDTFTVVVDEAATDAVVTVTDYTAGEEIVIDVLDPSVTVADGDAASVVRDTADGAVIAVGGVDVMLVAGVAATAVTGNVTVVNDAVVPLPIATGTATATA